MARLILIDGMIGAGKSTLAGDLERWLPGRGERARAYNEFAGDHPIRTQAIDRLRVAFAGGLDPAASAAAAAGRPTMPAGLAAIRPGSGARWRSAA
jgi:thymidylate kinase